MLFEQEKEKQQNHKGKRRMSHRDEEHEGAHQRHHHDEEEEAEEMHEQQQQHRRSPPHHHSIEEYAKGPDGIAKPHLHHHQHQHPHDGGESGGSARHLEENMTSDDVELAHTTGATTTAVTAAEAAAPKVDPTILEQLKSTITSSKINVLYIFIPIALIARAAKANDGFIFVTAFLALIPLAAVLGDYTEDLALRTNEAIGALINVTFGNATELIISIAALRYGEYELIRFSLVGSVLGNMLLVLGTSFIVGGLKNPSLSFNKAAAQTYMTTLMFASMGFLVPTAFSTIDKAAASDASLPLVVSREVSLLLIAIYGCYLYFQLKSHKHLFEGEEQEGEEEEEPQFTFAFAFCAIGVVAILISVLSDFLVDSVQGAAENLHISRHFIGLVLIPIVGNVAEHASAIIMAAKMKLDISLGIALGSSIQIAVFVMPLLCVIAWVVGKSLTLVFTPFTCSCLLASVVLTQFAVVDGSATWLSGCKMLAGYAMLVIAFFNAPDTAIEVLKKS